MCVCVVCVVWLTFVVPAMMSDELPVVRASALSCVISYTCMCVRERERERELCVAQICGSCVDECQAVTNASECTYLYYIYCADLLCVSV